MALICGATGRCGGAVARELLQDGQYGPRVVCLGNTRAPVFEDERADCRQVTLEALAAGSVPRGAGDGDGDGSIFADVSTIFFCIGTTRKASGKEGQVKLELDDTVAAAKAGASSFPGKAGTWGASTGSGRQPFLMMRKTPSPRC